MNRRKKYILIHRFRCVFSLFSDLRGDAFTERAPPLVDLRSAEIHAQSTKYCFAMMLNEILKY